MNPEKLVFRRVLSLKSLVLSLKLIYNWQHVYFEKSNNFKKINFFVVEHISISISMFLCLYKYIHIHIHVFRPSQDSSVWLRWTSREQLMLPECSKHQVLSFTKMLVVWWTNKKYSVLISVLQSAQWINSERISTYTCFVLPRAHQCGSS